MHSRYEVYCLEADNSVLLVGETDDPTGGLLVDVVERHPSWHTPTVLERKTKQVVMTSLPDVWPFPSGGGRG